MRAIERRLRQIEIARDQTNNPAMLYVLSVPADHSEAMVDEIFAKAGIEVGPSDLVVCLQRFTDGRNGFGIVNSTALAR